jgi:hypothetical protein
MVQEKNNEKIDERRQKRTKEREKTSGRRVKMVGHGRYVSISLFSLHIE